ncbi:MAG: hypothetical protein MUO31_09120 [Thermodesulfovibrionales bacterium]|nr:hypothetical protein [Thermodesulfovibrionales bacterium]
MKRLVIILFTVILIQGCATTYRSSGLMGGYKDVQLDENVFKITFHGNGYTSFERAADFTLMRCAELALNNGYSFFAIIDADSYTSNSTYTTPITTNTTGSAVKIGDYVIGSAQSITTGGQTYHTSKPSRTNTIICFKEKPTSGFSYNAKFIFKAISQKYKLFKK